MDGNQRVKVPMMFRGGMYETGYDEQLSCTILEMPYQGTISATFILPDEGKMKTVEEALKADTFDRWKKLITRRYEGAWHMRLLPSSCLPFHFLLLLAQIY